MKTRSLAILLAAAACGSASAVTFFAAPAATSNPKFTSNGTTTNKTASAFGDTYVVAILPHTMPKSGTFAWDFYAKADPGQILTSAFLTFNFSNGTNAKWATNTGAKYVLPSGEWSVPSSVTGLGALGAAGSQSIDLAAYARSEWHISATDTFILPAGVTITSVEAHVAQTVPEPASLAALALGGIGLLRRRKR